ncbi:MAG: Fe-S cluster assembly protein SufD, partial [Cyclobacteriaceae bacterium]|nr:Fe-S cluster assembly protein SufD [Cyclobacteriaceae bacterium]
AKVKDEKSLDAFINSGVPSLKYEEYKHSPVSKFLANSLKNFSENKQEKITHIDQINSKSIKIVFENGVLKGGNSIDIEGLTVEPLNSQNLNPVEHSVLSDPFQLLNKAQFTDGVKIVVKKNHQITTPIEIVYLNGGSDLISLPRIEIDVNESSSLEIIENYQYSGNNEIIIFPVLIAHVQKNARLKSCTLQIEGQNQLQVSNSVITQERDSFYKHVIISTSGKYLRNNHSVLLSDENCETHLYGLTLTSGKNLIDHHTVVDHMKPNCYSNELYKGILKEESTGIFNGRIFVRPNAQQTNAFQSNNNILLSDNATIHTKPQLEIWADDVKCSHGCTSGQLDEEAMFYLRTRGLDKNQSRGLLLKAFSDDVIQHIEIEEVKEYITEVVAAKLLV